MKHILVLILYSSLLSSALPQESDSLTDNSTFTLQLNQDNSFSFFPIIFGSIPLKRIDLTFYSVFWTTPAFANADGTGALIEAGAGIGITKGNWYLNPFVGFTHGIFTNNRDQNGYGRPAIFESVVPGAFLLMKRQRLESELFIAYYHNIREETTSSTNYLFWWILPGIRINRYFSTGAHFEQFRSTEAAIYMRYGFYAKATFKTKYELRLSFGFNDTPDETPDKETNFYKLTTNIPF
jgi:hypothetical protein